MPDQANAAAPAPLHNMGSPVPRIDGRLKVTGEARYAADFPINNLAHGVLLTSSIAKGEVSKIDLSRAREVPGVLMIVSYGDADGLEKPKFGNSTSSSMAPLASRQIFHDGQIIALIVADHVEAASQAAALIKLSYVTKAPTASFGDPGAEILLAKSVSPLHAEDPEVGNVEEALRGAAVTLEARYTTPTQHHNPIELFSTTCVWSDDELTVYEPSQNVYGFRAEIAKQLKIDLQKVRVISPYIGGAFGSKGPVTPRTAIVALAAKQLNRPVRCVVTRAQGFTTATFRAETQHHIRLGATEDGHLLGYTHEGWELTSRPDPYVVGGTDTTSRLYAYGAVSTKVNLVRADRNTPGFMRSPPETPYMFALESALDELALKLKIDPVEFRRLNDTMTDPISGKPYSSRSLIACFDQAAKAFGWSGQPKTPRSVRDGDWLVGQGCAAAVYPTIAGPATARVRLSANGAVRVQTASHEIGNGIRTVAAQMAVERLGTDVAACTVEMGDTNLPPAPVAGGSNSTASVCSAVLKASDAIRKTLFDAAIGGKGALAGRDPSTLDLKAGHVVGADGTQVALSDLFDSMGIGVIEHYAEFIPEGMKPDAVQELYAGQGKLSGGPKGKMLQYAFGAEFVEVRVHSRTGEIRVPRIVGAFAAGRIMNIRTARSQLMGGMIWGISAALLEATEVDRTLARYVNRDLADYMVPVNADIQQVDVILVPEDDMTVNPAGVKGLGELGNVGTTAAIANAVYQATGVRVRDLPIRLDALV